MLPASPLNTQHENERRERALQEARGESVTKLTQDLTRLVATLEEKARRLEKQASQAQSHVLQQLKERTSELAMDVRARHAEATSALDRTVQDLRTEKTSRAALAAILMKASEQQLVATRAQSILQPPSTDRTRLLRVGRSDDIHPSDCLIG